MRKRRNPLKASSVMFGLGLLGMAFSLALALSAASDARQAALLAEQAAGTDEYSLGFVPIIVPPAEIVGPAAAPTLPASTHAAGAPAPTRQGAGSAGRRHCANRHRAASLDSGPDRHSGHQSGCAGHVGQAQ